MAQHRIGLDANDRYGLVVGYDASTSEIKGALDLGEGVSSKGAFAEHLSQMMEVTLGDEVVRLTPSADGYAFAIPAGDDSSPSFGVRVGGQNFGEYRIHADGLHTVSPAQKLVGFEARSIAQSEAFLPFDRTQGGVMTPLTDLHTHFAGNLSADKMVDIALAKEQNPVYYPTYLLDSLEIDTAKYDVAEGKGVKLADLDSADMQTLKASMAISADLQETFNRMEEVYQYRGPIAKDPELFGDMLREIAKDYQSHGVEYAELAHASIINNPELMQTAHEVLPEIEAETGVKLRFLAATWRHSDKEWNQDEVDRIKQIAKSPYVVGIDVMGHETNPTRDVADELKTIAKWAIENNPDFTIRVHAGENPMFSAPEVNDWSYNNVKEALMVAIQARDEVAAEKGVAPESLPMPRMRIGHGLYGFDDETIQLFKETGAIVEFNMSSNLALNNIDGINEVPLSQYAEAGVPFVLGQDGSGIYLTSPEQEALLARAAGLQPEHFQALRDLEKGLVEHNASRFETQMATFNQAVQQQEAAGVSGAAVYEAIFKPVYDTPDGQPRMSPEVMQRYSEEQMEHEANLLSRVQREYLGQEVATDPGQVQARLAGKTPILITGASAKSWPDISPEQQDNITLTMQVLSDVLNPETTYLMTGGTHHGVEAQLHEAACRTNMLRSPDQRSLHVAGAFTEEALALKAGQVADVKNNTFTDAIVLKGSSGRIAERWFDLQDAALDMVEKEDGCVIAVGGGSVVRDMIQRAHGKGMELHLMTGPEGASTEKASVMTGQNYGFADPAGLIKKLYEENPERFREGFNLETLDQCVDQAKSRAGLKENPGGTLSMLPGVAEVVGKLAETLGQDLKRVDVQMTDATYRNAGARFSHQQPGNAPHSGHRR